MKYLDLSEKGGKNEMKRDWFWVAMVVLLVLATLLVIPTTSSAYKCMWSRLWAQATGYGIEVGYSYPISRDMHEIYFNGGWDTNVEYIWKKTSNYLEGCGIGLSQFYGRPKLQFEYRDYDVEAALFGTSSENTLKNLKAVLTILSITPFMQKYDVSIGGPFCLEYGIGGYLVWEKISGKELNNNSYIRDRDHGWGGFLRGACGRKWRLKNYSTLTISIGIGLRYGYHSGERGMDIGFDFALNTINIKSEFVHLF